MLKQDTSALAEILLSIPEGTVYYKSPSEPLPDGADIRDSAFSIETKYLTRDQLINMGYLPAEDQE